MFTLHMIINKIKDYRTDLDLSQKRLAEMVGISRQALHAIENGNSIPRLDLAFKIALALEQKIERIFSLNVEGKSDDKTKGGKKGFELFDHSLV